MYDWSKNSSDNPVDHDPMGSMECSLAEVISAKNRFERGLSPFRQVLGDSGVLYVYAEEQTGLKVRHAKNKWFGPKVVTFPTLGHHYF